MSHFHACDWSCAVRSDVVPRAERDELAETVLRLQAVVSAVEWLTKDTDGDAEIPIGEIRRVLHEAGPVAAPPLAEGGAP